MCARSAVDLPHVGAGVPVANRDDWCGREQILAHRSLERGFLDEEQLRCLLVSLAAISSDVSIAISRSRLHRPGIGGGGVGAVCCCMFDENE